jgi:hypothetical protein
MCLIDNEYEAAGVEMLVHQASSLPARAATVNPRGAPLRTGRDPQGHLSSTDVHRR